MDPDTGRGHGPGIRDTGAEHDTGPRKRDRDTFTHLLDSETGYAHRTLNLRPRHNTRTSDKHRSVSLFCKLRLTRPINMHPSPPGGAPGCELRENATAFWHRPFQIRRHLDCLLLPGGEPASALAQYPAENTQPDADKPRDGKQNTAVYCEKGLF